ncbi:hypothetical protein ACGFSB_36605 [Streptomyces sp. NPDC048441]|uniref:hypothetical protein n=1 Tax=Streptomyces sp. NPDC048441 TaxID=3365552 RepID=UPI0037102EBF
MAYRPALRERVSPHGLLLPVWCVLLVVAVVGFIAIGFLTEIIAAVSSSYEKVVGRRTANASAPRVPKKPRPTVECEIPWRPPA